MRITDIRAREAQRLQFVKNDSGISAAVSFARQGLYVYRAALARRSSNGKCRIGYGKEYRAELVGSCLEYRSFIRTHRVDQSIKVQDELFA